MGTRKFPPSVALSILALVPQSVQYMYLVKQETRLIHNTEAFRDLSTNEEDHVIPSARI